MLTLGRAIPDLIFDTCGWLMPKSAAICHWRRVSRFISSTCSLLSVAHPFRSPNAFLSFFTESTLFSCLVPAKRCSGLTHDGVSHLWQATKSSGKSPLNILYISRCARTAFPSFHIIGYPARFKCPVHSQQPEESNATFAISRSRKVRFSDLPNCSSEPLRLFDS